MATRNGVNAGLSPHNSISKPDVSLDDDAATTLADGGLQPPELVAKMTPDDRVRLENHLRRKIDYRLLPMVILMYIMNYLDRNNIAAARIAGPQGKGLEDELGMTSSQYQVCYIISISFPGPRDRGIPELMKMTMGIDEYQHSVCGISSDAE
jgi:hypothetical protein